jgi:hypothetical protein
MVDDIAVNGILTAARECGIAVAIETRADLEETLGRDMTEEEWARVSPLLKGFNDWIHASSADTAIEEWRYEILAAAGVELAADEPAVDGTVRGLALLIPDRTKPTNGPRRVRSGRVVGGRRYSTPPRHQSHRGS